MNPLNDELFFRLQTECGQMMKANGASPKTAKGRQMIHLFWYGAMCALNTPNNPRVCIRLLSGRHDELMIKE